MAGNLRMNHSELLLATDAWLCGAYSLATPGNPRYGSNTFPINSPSLFIDGMTSRSRAGEVGLKAQIWTLVTDIFVS